MALFYPIKLAKSMKAHMVLVFSFFLLFPYKALGNDELRLTITVDSGVVVGILENNKITQQLRSLSPLKLKMQDFNHTERIAYPPEKLDLKGDKKGLDPKIGDIAVFGPWGNICIYIHDAPYSGELYYLGRIISGLDLLAAKKNEFQATFEISQ